MHITIINLLAIIIIPEVKTRDMGTPRGKTILLKMQKLHAIVRQNSSASIMYGDSENIEW